MNSRVAFSLILLLILSTESVTHAPLRAEETSAKPANTPNRPAAAASDKVTSAAAIQEEAERKKIWTSPEMLKARAWVDDYFSVTKQYSPQQKAEYKKHLASLTAPQMKMWLMRFEHDRLDAKKREQSSDAARQARIARDKSNIKQYQKSLSDIEKGENMAAANEEKRLKSEQTFARSMYRQKQREATRMLEEYSSGGFGGGFGRGF